MRTSEARIKAALLHPEEEIRVKALDYFARSPTDDETIMALVIEAVEKFGPEKAFGVLRAADGLPQTEATIRWLTGELDKERDLEDVGNDNYRTAVALVLCRARPDLLRPEIARRPAFPEELQRSFHERLQMASWDWETAWAAFERFGREVRDRGKFRLGDVRRGERLVEALARHGDRAEVILPILHRRYRGHERNVMEWLEAFIVELAGKMRLDAAVPVLVDCLHEDDLDLADACARALAEIGGNTVVVSLAGQWPQGGAEFRTSAAEILEHVHTGLSAEKCLEFFVAEEDQEVMDFLSHALLGNFVPQAVELIRPWLREGRLTPDEMDVKHHLIAAATIMGTTFPGYDAWYQEAQQSNWGWGDHPRGRIREHLREEDEPGTSPQGEA